jgi:hypothetical protein
MTHAQCAALKHIKALIADGGDITVGALWLHKCVSAAADQSKYRGNASKA